MKFCVDPGHGGADSGAVGPTGLREADVVLWLSRYVSHGLMEAGHEVLLTRNADDSMTLPERCRVANQRDFDFFLSIHANANANRSAHGYEVWTSPGWTPADPVATRIFDSIGASFPNLTPRFDRSDGDVDKESKFYVLVHTRMPAVLVETAFISNALEETWLRDPGWRLRMAGAIVSATFNL